MSIGIIGYGFVGKAAAQLEKTNYLNIYDPYIEEYNSNKSKREAFGSDIVFVCVPTPSDKSGALDVSVVIETTKQWKVFKEVDLATDRILVIKSTIPVGTTDELCESFNDQNIVHNPEFLTQRTAMEDFKNADEIIVGGPNTEACESVLNLYKNWFALNDDHYEGRVFRSVSGKMAEMIKVVRNSFYAVKVEFMNEVADLCSEMGVDYDEFRDLFARSGRHAWVNPQHTYVPGPDGQRGFGGKCLPKDSSGLARLAADYSLEMEVVAAAVKANKKRRNDV